MSEHEFKNTTLENGEPVENSPDYREIDQMTGMQKAYVVLSAEERAKGFTRPVRRSYRHIGRVFGELKDLDPVADAEQIAKGYVKLEARVHEGKILGWAFLKPEDLKSGCGGNPTTMGLAISETYARDPRFYGSTFCSFCKVHFPVGEFVWYETDERVGS